MTRQAGLGAVVAASLAFTAASPAEASLAGALLGTKLARSTSGKYRKGNQIRVTSYVTRTDYRIDEFGAALAEMARMARAKGYERFAVIKVSDCGTMLMNNIEMYRTCRLVGQMVGDDEAAKPEKGHPVKYYRVVEVIGPADNSP